MQLKNKKIVIIGDSITEGVGASCKEKAYPSVLAEISGATVYNYGISATRYAYQMDEFNEYKECFIDRAARIKEEPDVILVFGGTNDFGHGDAPFGTDTDRDGYTYLGACHKLYSSLLQKFPDARIVILTPLHRLSENNTVKEVRNIPTLPLKAYVDAQRRTAEYYGLPIIDLYSISGLQPAIEEIRVKYMPDGLHPSDDGAKRIAEIIYAQLLAL
jgi:lysophospholipase L1-like esterase